MQGGSRLYSLGYIYVCSVSLNGDYSDLPGVFHLEQPTCVPSFWDCDVDALELREEDGEDCGGRLAEASSRDC